MKAVQLVIKRQTTKKVIQLKAGLFFQSIIIFLFSKTGQLFYPKFSIKIYLEVEKQTVESFLSTFLSETRILSIPILSTRTGTTRT